MTKSQTPARPGFEGSGSPQAANALFATARRGSFDIIIALFCGLLLLSNIAATKLIEIGPVPLVDVLIFDGGAILFPLTYILGDVLSEVYGFKAARRAIMLGFALSILAALTFYLVQVAPPAADYANQSAFESVLGFVPRIVAASLAGYLVGQFLNAIVLVKIKERFGERHLWVRLMGSTVVGEFADTLVFCTIAFYGVVAGAEFVNYVLVGYVYKVLIEAVLLPVTYPVIRLVKRSEPSYAVAE